MKPESMLDSAIFTPNNLQPAAALPAQLKIRRVVFAAGWALHVAGYNRCVFVGIDDTFGAREIVVAGDPDFRVGVSERDFSGDALRMLIKNLRRNVGVFEQIQYYLRFHQIVGGVDFLHVA